jgi:membrane-associated phospholipid phosphatase
VEKVDVHAFLWLNRGRGPLADAIFEGMTELGSIWAAAGAASVLFVVGRRREALDAFGAAAAMWALGQVAKKVTRRPRPYQAMEDVRLLIERPHGSSWPSSHPAVLLAFVTVASRDLGVGPVVTTGLKGLAGMVGVSRVYVGVHYPADVVGGLLLGHGLAGLWSRLVSPRTTGTVRA